jgi:hypothetical protein
MPFFLDLEAGRWLISAEPGDLNATAFMFVSEEVFLAGGVCEMHLLQCNNSAQQKTVITNIRPGRLWFVIRIRIFILRISRNYRGWPPVSSELYMDN